MASDKEKQQLYHNYVHGLRREEICAIMHGRQSGKSGFYWDTAWPAPDERHKITVSERDLEKHPALKEAYEHFRMIEKLCIGGKRVE